MTQEKLFQYFKDPECREPIYNIEFPEPVVSGREKAELIVYARNITPAELYDLEFIPVDPDLKIERENKDKVFPQETIMLKFIFSPSEDRKEPLDTGMNVTAKGIIRAKREKPL
jgi:hypothetical protein